MMCFYLHGEHTKYTYIYTLYIYAYEELFGTFNCQRYQGSLLTL